MQPDEKVKFEMMQRDIVEIKKDFQGFAKRFDEVYAALLGSPISKDGGLVGRISELETDVVKLKAENEQLRNANTRRDLYLNIIWAMGGTLIASVGIWIINYILKKPV